MATSTSSWNQYPSTLLIPEDVVWLPYASLVVMVLSWLGYDFFRFHRKNKLKYARMRETKVVEKEQPSRKRINMISSVGLRYKNGLPVLGDVWNTSASASEYSISSHARKIGQEPCTDISPSDDECPHEIPGNSEFSTLDDETPEMPVERRRVRSPRYVGPGGGASERSKADNSQTSYGFSVQETSKDGSLTKSHSSSKGLHGRNRKIVDKMKDTGGGGRGGGGGGGGRSHRDKDIGDDYYQDGGGGGGGRSHRDEDIGDDYYQDGGGGGGGGGRSHREDDDEYYQDGGGGRDGGRLGDTNNIEDDRVVGDSATQTSYTMADLHFNTTTTTTTITNNNNNNNSRSGPQIKDPGSLYTHPGVVNPRVLAISPPKHSSSPGRDSPSRSHRSRVGSHSSLRQSQSQRGPDNDSTDQQQSVAIDFSRSSSMREERSGDSATNPSTPKHQHRRRDTNKSSSGQNSGGGRQSREVVEPERIDEPVFPGSIRRLPATPIVFQTQTNPSSRSGSSAFNKPQPSSSSSSSSKRQTSFSRHAAELESRVDNISRSSSQRDEKPKPNEAVYQHLQSRKERDREQSHSARNPPAPSSETRESQKVRPATSRTSRTSSSASPKPSSGEKRHRKTSETSRNSSSDSIQIPQHFYNDDEEGFFSSKSSRDPSSSAHRDAQQLPRKGIHFFSQLASGRRDSTSGHRGRKASISGGYGGGFDGDGGNWNSSGFSGGGFES